MSMEDPLTEYDPTDEEIVGWLIRVNEPGFADWEEFDIWLAQDDERAARYWRSADTDSTVRDHLSTSGSGSGLAPAVPPIMARRHRAVKWSLTGGAAVAAIALVTGLLPIQKSSLYVVETGPGMRRSVSLAGVGRIDLNGDSKVTLDHADRRRARLDRGEALLTITHDAAHPFALAVGRLSIEDVGTVFNVVRDDAGAVEVAVGEGAVELVSDRRRSSLRQGESLHVSLDGGASRPTLVQPDAVGAWHAGRLVYDDAPMTKVAADLRRAGGYRVTLASGIVGRRFTGTVTIGDTATLIRRAAALLDVEAHARGNEWFLTASPHPPR